MHVSLIKRWAKFSSIFSRGERRRKIIVELSPSGASMTLVIFKSVFCNLPSFNGTEAAFVRGPKSKHN
jgi:hypothetical protein